MLIKNDGLQLNCTETVSNGNIQSADATGFGRLEVTLNTDDALWCWPWLFLSLCPLNSGLFNEIIQKLRQNLNTHICSD